jgi:hypothetical protein
LAGREVGEGEVAEGGAVEGEDFAALAGEHAADLMVAAFGEGELGGTGIEDTELGGKAGIFFAGEEERAAGEEFDEAGWHVAGERGAVEFGDFVLGRGEAVDEGALVGEEEEAAGVFVEAADAGDLGIAGAPAGREEAVDVGAFAFVVGADEAEGFVEEEKEFVGVVGGLAVDEDIGGVGLGAEIGDDFSLHGDAAGFDPVAGFAAGAVAEVGEELVEAAHVERVKGEGGGVKAWRGGKERRGWGFNLELRKAGKGRGGVEIWRG